MIILGFILSLGLFVVIGLLSSLKSKSTSRDYLMAGQSVPDWLAALSAVSTSNSGYMFVGMIGYTYLTGLSAIWIALGWTVGDLVISFFAHPKLRKVAEQERVNSYPGALAQWMPKQPAFTKLQKLGGAITLLFLSIYAAAQLNAGSKALHVLLGWDYATGAIIGSVIVLAYCIAGGIRASIWTDAAQGIVMLGAMSMMALVAVNSLGGWDLFVQQLAQVSPTYLSVFPPDMLISGGLGLALFAISWLFMGVGVIGQPHIMIRFMALSPKAGLAKTRFYYYTFQILFYFVTILSGMAARLMIPPKGFDEELALPMLALQTMPEFFVGLVLAGLFAATMSTADSQILSCTASVTQDIHPKLGQGIWGNKLTTFFITATTLLIALFGPKSVFDLVVLSWAALSCCFGPLLLLLALGRDVKQPQGIAMVLTGFVVMLIWRELGLNPYVVEALPGMVLSFVMGWFWPDDKKQTA